MLGASNLKEELQRRREKFFSKQVPVAAPKTARRMREVPWASNLMTELQRERGEKLFALVDPHHMLQRDQFGWSLDKMNVSCRTQS